MNTSQVYIQALNTRSATLFTANNMLDGTGPMSEIFVAGPNGSRVDKILVKALAATSSGLINIFIGNGSAIRLVTQAVVEPMLPSLLATTFETVISTTNIFTLPPGWTLYASITRNEYFSITAFGGDF